MLDAGGTGSGGPFARGSIRVLHAGSELPVLPGPLRGPSNEEASLESLSYGRAVVVYFYPGRSSQDPKDRGLHKAFNDAYRQLSYHGVQVIGISSETPREQMTSLLVSRICARLVNDQDMRLASAIGLPTFEWGGRTRYHQLVLMLRSGVAEQVIYPVSDPSGVLDQVWRWLSAI